MNETNLLIEGHDLCIYCYVWIFWTEH